MQADLSSPPAGPALAALSDVDQYALWNPAAAVNWSLLFTPAFGAYVQMLNWQALGEPRLAAHARVWFYLSLAILALNGCWAAVAARLNDSGTPVHWSGIAYLLAWYFLAGRSQVTAVRTRLGAGYVRKRWDSVVLVAIVAGVLGISLRESLTFVLRTTS